MCVPVSVPLVPVLTPLVSLFGSEEVDLPLIFCF